MEITSKKKANVENPNQAVNVEETKESFSDEIDVRIATIGNVDSGKSTMVGVLTSN